jgi:hypothetical protein
MNDLGSRPGVPLADLRRLILVSTDAARLTRVELPLDWAEQYPAPLQLSELAFPGPSCHNARPGFSTRSRA